MVLLNRQWWRAHIELLLKAKQNFCSILSSELHCYMGTVTKSIKKKNGNSEGQKKKNPHEATKLVSGRAWVQTQVYLSLIQYSC